MSRHIDIEKAIPIAIQKVIDIVGHGITQVDAVDIATAIEDASTADVVEVVRCKDCKHFQPEFVLTNEGERRPYTEEEKALPLGVAGDVGINCGSRCERYWHWRDNKVPVFMQEYDFCSHGEKREEK